MGDIVITCTCGHRMRAPEFAWGMKGRCNTCGAAITVDENNSQLIDPLPSVEPEHAIYTESTALADLNVPPMVPVVEDEAENPWRGRLRFAFAGLLMATAIGALLWVIASALLDASLVTDPETGSVVSIAVPARAGPAFSYLTSSTALFVALYIVLRHNNKLPNDTFLQNGVALGVVCMPVTAVGYIPVPYFGCALGLLVLVYVLMNIYELLPGEVVLVLIAKVLVHLVLWSVKMSVLSILSLIVQ